MVQGEHFDRDRGSGPLRQLAGVVLASRSVGSVVTSKARPATARTTTREDVLLTARGLHDAGGTPNLTMTKVADAVGFTTVAVYGYVRDREDLIEGTVALVLRHPPCRRSTGLAPLRGRRGSPWACSSSSQRRRCGRLGGRDRTGKRCPSTPLDAIVANAQLPDDDLFNDVVVQTRRFLDELAAR